MGRKLTIKEFTSKAKEIHGDRYDYSLVDYINSKTEVEIICDVHGIFNQKPEKHINRGSGCPNCSKTKKLTTESFITQALEVHGNKYDYNKTEYVNAKCKVIISCSKHGDFEQTPSSHISQKTGCPKCSKKYNYTTEEFIGKAQSLHNMTYTYGKVVYSNNYTKIIITCPKHGDFEQTPANHLKGKGCSTCKESKGEGLIGLWLDKNEIPYITQHKFDDCVNERRLPFDFYLPTLNTCIEFQGKQHYVSVEFFGGEEGFRKQRKRDSIKESYCKSNKINLLKINYNQDINIELADYNPTL
tara:strand:- start:3652 stop:4551 length:900 start_codon:yes stop_codon:yes gene_type:complete